MLAFPRAFVAMLAAATLGLSGCAEEPKADVLTLLRTEAEASLRNAATKVQESRSLAFTMEVTDRGSRLTGRGALSFGPPIAMVMVIDTPNGAMESRRVGNIQYLKMPRPSRAGIAGKPWIKMDLAKAAETAGLDGSELSDHQEQADPTKQIRALLEGGKLAFVGEDTVDGVRTVHYSGWMSLDEYVKKVKPDMRPLQRALLDIGQVTAVTTDLWVDEHYQPRLLDMSMGHLKFHVRYKDYGKPVTVLPPPASETVDVSELRQRQPA